jgi:hypothetical protein
MRLEAEVKGKHYKISYSSSSLSLFSKVTFFSSLSFKNKPFYSAYLTSATSSGLAAW